MTEPNGTPKLPGGKRIARNTTWNLIGMCTPMLLALFCMPPMIEGLGHDRFGPLTLIWMLVGYFTILDMGIGRTLTKVVAERMAQNREQDLPGLFWTSCLIMLGIGAVAGIVLIAIAPWLTTSVLTIPKELQNETLRSFQAVAVSLPILVMSVGMQGMLEARQRFGLINLVRVPMGSFVFFGPLLVLPFSKSLFSVVLVLVAGRVIEWLIYFSLCLHDLPALRHGIRWARNEVKPLLSTGIWINISMLIMPFMLQIDRFLIGGILTVGAVTYYAIPSEMVVKLLIFPRALVSVLFPTFAAHFGQSQDKTSELFARSLSWLMGLLLPVILIVVAFAPEGFHIWLGSDFELQSTPIMRLLATGIFVYCLTYIPFSFLQGIGRPDITARIHLIEFPLFVILAIHMTKQFGITGAAMAWVIRAILEFIVMLGFAMKFAPVIKKYTVRWAVCGTVALAMIALIVLCAPLPGRLVITLSALLAWAAITWFYMFDKEDRHELQLMLKAFRPTAMDLSKS